MSTPLSKEEIVRQEYEKVFASQKYGGSVNKLMNQQYIFPAMEQYSRIQSISFFKWYGVKMAGFMEYIKDIRPTVISDEIEEKIKEFEGKDFETLYNLFIEHQSKQP